MVGLPLANKEFAIIGIFFIFLFRLLEKLQKIFYRISALKPTMNRPASPFFFHSKFLFSVFQCLNIMTNYGIAFTRVEIIPYVILWLIGRRCMTLPGHSFYIVARCICINRQVEPNSFPEKVLPGLGERNLPQGCRFQTLDPYWELRNNASWRQQAATICLTKLNPGLPKVDRNLAERPGLKR